jgi:hypothetical protein
MCGNSKEYLGQKHPCLYARVRLMSNKLSMNTDSHSIVVYGRKPE